MTWDDDDDDNDYSTNYWGKGPPPVQNGQAGKHSAFNTYQGQGRPEPENARPQYYGNASYEQADLRHQAPQNHSQDPRSRHPEDRRGQSSRSYGDPRSDRQNYDKQQSSEPPRRSLENRGERPRSYHGDDPRSQQNYRVDDPRSQQNYRGDDPRSQHPAYDPYNKSATFDRQNLYSEKDNRNQDYDRRNQDYDRRNQDYDRRTPINNSTENRRTPQPKYSDAAYDQQDGRSRFPSSRSPTARSPPAADVNSDPHTGEYLYSKPIKRQDRVPQGHQQNARSRPNNQTERSVSQGSSYKKSDENPYMQMGPGRSLEKLSR